MSKLNLISLKAIAGIHFRRYSANAGKMEESMLTKRKKLSSIFFLTLLSFFSFTLPIFAQAGRPKISPEADDYTLYWIFLILLVIGSGVALWWWLSKKAAVSLAEKAVPEPARLVYNEPVKNNIKKTVNREKRENREVEIWIREQAILAKEGAMGVKKKKPAKTSDSTLERFNNTIDSQTFNRNFNVAKPKIVPFEALPIFKMRQLILVREPALLPVSFEPELDEAIEQIRRDDFDEEFREVAVRILAAFRAQNAVDCLAQVAHYDLSQRLRVAAVVSLGEFDHQAVFEPILLACADMSREVKAAAARTLIKLNFDRADALCLILQSQDVERIRMAALSCIEAGLAERAFDRLLSQDYRQAYEAFVILTALVKAKQPQMILSKIEANKNPQTSLATIHVLDILQPFEFLPEIQKLTALKLTPEVNTALNELTEKLSVAIG